MIPILRSTRRRPYAALGALLLTVSACASAGTPVTPPAPTPQPEPVPPPPPPAATAAAEPILEAPRNWHLLDQTADRLAGISADLAVRELLAGRDPARTVVVAVIDGGVDTAHADIAANLWKNPDEMAGNGRDDDGNGYADDVFGWNFIGGADGENVHHDTFELTRLHAACTGAPAATGPAPPADECRRIAADYERRRNEVEGTLQQIGMIDAALSQALPILRQAVGGDSLTVARVRALQPMRTDVQRARQLYLQLVDAGLPPDELPEAREAYESQSRYALDPSFNPRPIVGDDYADVTERDYGNRDVTGPDAVHGTHVAGIIAAVRGNGEGIDGIAPAVRVMVVRAVPDGDERDKDVANAIRYAVDNGAHIINMSFGKAYSPGKAVVDEAVKYADEKDVLMIHAAGNDGEDLAQTANYPNPIYADGGRAANWIEVGASSWKPADSLAAPFSNYGREQVDVFAPGVDILSTEPGGEYGRNSGTSMAAPVVTGVAALIMAYYPELSAGDVKRIILESATRHGDRMVLRPGADNGERVPFSALSVTGAVVNAYAALRMAAAASSGGR